MAKILWGVICQRAIIDERTKTLSMIDVMDEIKFGHSEPIVEGVDWFSIPQACTISVLVERSEIDKPEKPEIRIRIISPTGEIFKSTHDNVGVEVDLSDKNRSRLLANLDSLPFFCSGIYLYAIEVKTGDEWVEHEKISLDIRQN